MLSLGRCHELAREVQFVVNFDEQIWQLDTAEIVRHPLLEFVQPSFSLCIEFLGLVSCQMPALLINTGIGVLWQKIQEPIIGLIKPVCQIGRHIFCARRQTSAPEESLPHDAPLGI